MQANRMSIAANDGTSIPVAAYHIGDEPVRGIVIVSHGFGEHSGSYEQLAECLHQEQYATVVLDQRGHGDLGEESLTIRRKRLGVIPGYQSFLDDIAAVTAELKRRFPNTPLVLYGHSMGGNIAINCLLRHSQSAFACAVIESPWLGLYKEFPPLIYGVAKVLGHLSPAIAIVNTLSPSDITGDPVRAQEIAEDPLYHNRISMRMFSGIKDGAAFALKNAATLSVPTFVASAKYDRIVSNEKIREFLSLCGSHVVSAEYESNHSIHNDRKKDDFHHDLLAFVNKHCIAL